MELVRCNKCGQPHQSAYSEGGEATAKTCWPCRFKASTGISLNPTKKTSPPQSKGVLSI